MTDRGIRSLELDKVDRFQLEDAGLQDELNRALAAVAGARDQDKKPVDIRFNGQGERHVRLGYVVETPIWKASYRLVLPDNADARKQKATLQGWAIVENQTDNDWKDVRLSLVSGRPISFIQRPLPAALRAAPDGGAGALCLAAAAGVRGRRREEHRDERLTRLDAPTASRRGGQRSRHGGGCQATREAHAAPMPRPRRHASTWSHSRRRRRRPL